MKIFLNVLQVRAGNEFISDATFDSYDFVGRISDWTASSNAIWNVMFVSDFSPKYRYVSIKSLYTTKPSVVAEFEIYQNA